MKLQGINSSTQTFPGKGNDNLLQYSCPENFMGRGVWQGPWGCKESDTTEYTHTHTQNSVDNCHHNDGRRNNSWWEGGSMFQESNSEWGRKQPLLPTFRSTELQKVHIHTWESRGEGDLACQLPVMRGHEHLKCEWCGWGTESLIEFNSNQVKSWSYIKIFSVILFLYKNFFTDLLFW